MWVQTFHRFADRAAFLAACDAAGWARVPDGQPDSPQGVALDVIGPAAAPPTMVNGAIIPGAVDAGWHVNASWFSGTTIPAGFVAAEIIPERPIQMFAAEAPAQEVVAIRAAFEARKLAKPDDLRLVAVAAEDAIEKPG